MIILRATSHLDDTAALEHVDALVAVHVEVLRRGWSYVVRHRVVAVDLVVRRHARYHINVVCESICAHTKKMRSNNEAGRSEKGQQTQVATLAKARTPKHTSIGIAEAG